MTHSVEGWVVGTVSESGGQLGQLCNNHRYGWGGHMRPSQEADMGLACLSQVHALVSWPLNPYIFPFCSRRGVDSSFMPQELRRNNFWTVSEPCHKSDFQKSEGRWSTPCGMLWTQQPAYSTAFNPQWESRRWEMHASFQGESLGVCKPRLKGAWQTLPAFHRW